MHKAISDVITIAAPRPPLVKQNRGFFTELQKRLSFFGWSRCCAPFGFFIKDFTQYSKPTKMGGGSKTRIGKRAVLWYDILS